VHDLTLLIKLQSNLNIIIKNKEQNNTFSIINFLIRGAGYGWLRLSTNVRPLASEEI